MKRPRGVTILCIVYALLGILAAVGGVVMPKVGFLAPICVPAAGVILISGAILMFRSRPLGWLIIPIGLLLTWSTEAALGRHTRILLVIHLCYFALPSARRHLTRPPAREGQSDRRNRRRTWWIAFSLVVLLLCVAITIHRSRLSSQIDKELASVRSADLPVSLEELDKWYAVPVDVPNAADTYAKAFELIVWNDDWTDLLPRGHLNVSQIQAMPQKVSSKLSDCVKANQGAIELLCRAGNIEECRYPADLTKTLEWGPFSHSDSPPAHLSQIQSCISVLLCAAAHYAERDDVKSACDAATASLALSNSLRREPRVFSQMVRVAALSAGRISLWRIINRCSPREDTLDGMRKSLEASRSPEALRRGFIGERVILNTSFQMEAGWFRGGGPLYPHPTYPEVLFLRATGLMQLDHLTSLRFLAAYIELSGRPPRERVKGAAELGQELRALPKWRSMTRKELLPLKELFIVEVEALARLDLMLAALAVERSRLKTGKLPGSLDALVPHYLPEPLTDPFDGKPIRFLPDDVSYKLYSVGRDKTDNGGEIEADIILDVKRGGEVRSISGGSEKWKESVEIKEDETRKLVPHTALFLVKVNGRYGYIDKTGELVIEPQFYLAQAFSDGLALVKAHDSDEEQSIYIDKTGTAVFKDRFGAGDPFAEGLVPVRVGDHKTGKWGYIDTTGKMVIEPRFHCAGPFSEGLAIVSLERGPRVKFGTSCEIELNKHGYIDKTGKVVVEPKFDAAGDFSEGLAAVRIGDFETGKWGYIDKTGKMVIEPQFGYSGNFSEGLARFWTGDEDTGEWGYIDKTGKVVIEPQFGYGMDFSEGLAGVRIGDKETGKWGYIDKTGKVVLEAKFDAIGSFSGGLAAVRVGDEDTGKWGYIDKTGKIVIEPQFESAAAFSQGLALVEVPHGRRYKHGYIDKTGKYVWGPMEW